MKKTKILVPALSVLALGMAAAVTGTVAWFSANNIVTASGMAFNSVTPSSLAIGKELGASGIGKATAISWNDPATTLNPTSHWHYDSSTSAEVEDQTGAYYAVSNGQDIDPETGLALEDPNGTVTVGTGENAKNYRQINFMSATQGTYYVDYTCYIASVGQAITIYNGGYLRATPTFSFTTGENVQHSDTINAATVDFFVYAGATYNSNTSAVNPGNAAYVQGVNAIGKDYTVNQHATYPGKVASVGTQNKTYSDILVAGANIPVASSNFAIMVTMRFYFDGALLKDSNNTYVATNRLDTTDVTVSVSFELNRGTNPNA